MRTICSRRNRTVRFYRFVRYSFVLLFLVQNLGADAGAQVSGFPYARRTRPYQGWSALVKGDNNTIGMAGATVAVPANISALALNPAGFAMHLNGLAAMINKQSINAPETNHGGEGIKEVQWGLGTSMPPWGFGITYYSPASENVDHSEVSVRQLRLSAARLFGRSLAFGMSVEFVRAIRDIDGDDLGTNWYSTQFGMLFKTSTFWTVGLSVKPGVEIGRSAHTELRTAQLGFNQKTKVPTIVALGVGFMPNRFFRAGASLLAVDGTKETALLYRDEVAYGQRASLQPRLGASYVFADFRNFKAEIAAGMYYEWNRVATLPNRMHGTFSLDLNPYFINTGVAADLSTTYKNWIVSVGADIVRLFRTFEIIPRDPVPPHNDFFPRMLEPDVDGLPDGYTQGLPKSVSPPSAEEVQRIVEDIPRKISEKLGPAPDAEKRRKSGENKKR